MVMRHQGRCRHGDVATFAQIVFAVPKCTCHFHPALLAQGNPHGREVLPRLPAITPDFKDFMNWFRAQKRDFVIGQKVLQEMG